MQASRFSKFDPSCRQVGFSLVELLVVVAMVGMLGAMAMGGLNNSVRSARISSTAQTIADAFALARANAVSRNVPVEVRLYKLPDSISGTSPTAYRAIQVVAQDASKTAVTRPYFFSDTVLASTTTGQSSLLTDTTLVDNPAIANTKVGGYTAYNYKSIVFRPNGMTSLDPAKQWYLTIAPKAGKPGEGGWPLNFATVNLQPMSGVASVIEPR